MAQSEEISELPRSSASSYASTSSSVVALREAITPNGLVTIASRVHGCPPTHCTVDSANPLHGSFNLVYIVTFSDTPTKWVARIPLHGMKETFHESDAKALEAQTTTLRFIKQNTDIPVPEVVHYDVTFENELGAPFVMMTWLEGIPVSKVWFDATCDPDTLEKRRENILKSTAMAMIQLRFFSAPKLGELEFEPATATTKDNKLRVKSIKNLHSFHLDETTEDITFSDLGPFDHTQDYLRSLALDSQPHRSLSHFSLGQRKLLEIMIDAIPIVENEQFVLAHADYDSQNFLVNQEGNLTGVLDWDDVAAYPRCLGYTRYPAWITRDWDPMAYGFGCEEPAGVKEDSPETLRKLRKRYREIIEEELGEEEASAMANSHLYEAIEIAARNPMHSSAIVNLLVRRCIREPLFEIPLGGDDEEDDAQAREGEEGEEENEDQPDQPKENSADNGKKADIGADEYQVDEEGGRGRDTATPVDHEADLEYIPGWVFDLCEALGKGCLEEKQIEALRQRFRDMLTLQTHIGD